MGYILDNITIFQIIFVNQKNSTEVSLKVPSHKSYMQRHAPPQARLLTLRRNAAIPPRSRVQLIVCVAPHRVLSRVGLPRPPHASYFFHVL